MKGGLYAWRKSQLEPRNNMEGLAVRREGEEKVQLSSRNMACPQPVCKVITWYNRQILQTPLAGSCYCSTVAESDTGNRKLANFHAFAAVELRYHFETTQWSRLQGSNVRCRIRPLKVWPLACAEKADTNQQLMGRSILEKWLPNATLVTESPVNFILLPETEMFLHFKLSLLHFCYLLGVNETLISISISISKLSAIQRHY
jgi:hypothetical protein